MAVATYTKAGVKATSPAKLDKAVFGVEVQNHELLKAAYVAYLANGRGSDAVTLKRGEVRGGGRKPWKQKGTGRARFGSSRNPIWRGGGITFGPSGNENHSHKITPAAKRKALCQALSLANEAGKLVVIDDLSFKGKTAEAVKLFAKIGIDRSALVVVDNKTPEVTRSTDNLNDVKLVAAAYVNVFDVMNADKVVMTSAALTGLTARLTAELKRGEK
jgi:large subunit ribosomal protein L4